MTPFGQKLHNAGLVDEAKAFEAAAAAWGAAPEDENVTKRLLGVWARCRLAYSRKTGEPIMPRNDAAKVLLELLLFPRGKPNG